MELLKFADKHFAAIDKLKAQSKWDEVYQYIDACAPPDEWIVELPSKASKGETYKTIPIDVMEAAIKRIFGRAWIEGIQAPIVSQDKNGRFATTVVLAYAYSFGGVHSGYLNGVATVSSPDISMLELATPKASTMALKTLSSNLADYSVNTLIGPLMRLKSLLHHLRTPSPRKSGLPTSWNS
jgi:hypothetical protein